MRNILQIVGGVAAAGVIAAGTTALTGSGTVFGGLNGGTATQFVGGTVQQTITGATVDNVVYLNDATGTKTTSIAVTVSGATNKYLTLTPGGTGLSTIGDGTAADEWACTGAITGGPIYHASAPKVQLTSSPATVTCVPSLASGPHQTQGWYKGLTTLDMAVTNS
ncbi:hypothetical protein Ade02nite_86180 [Paractinoplanes deccanensis]|uniref:Uncharacterized protein n=1 Tax=Paractinoplanes deccanensis TaxID=113561 RepID=A0ABQ3YJ08_9ACTN|nr:hypothetical protein [Actinoplanes deccanensis]GID79977.1 hypothetical protein Ade02nite_86180 [Actinoplanes deccanensis]